METDWEQRYREEDTPWDKGKPAPGLVDWLSNQNESKEMYPLQQSLTW